MSGGGRTAAAGVPAAWTTGRFTIGDLVTSWAERAPGRAAIESLDGATLSFADLADQLVRTERELGDHGLGPGSRVAVVLDNSPELACAFLGIASAASCAPLNPAYRENELDFYLSDLQAAAVVVRAGSESPARAAAERAGALVLELTAEDAAGSFTLAAPTGVSEAPARADDGAALLLHTSGTTARPKLVPLGHANLAASAAAVGRTLALTPDDRCLAVMPLFHIHGLVASVLAPLTAGSTVVVTPAFDAVRFLDWLDQAAPTWYSAVPTMHMAILDRVRSAPERAARSGLRLIRSSSAALPTSVLDELEEVFACPVVEAYGMTEAAHQMASNPLPPASRKPGSVGLPAGPEIAVLDAAGNRLAPGELGEVAVRGPGVFSGYDANPEATAAAFVGGWFRTGDEGYLDEDGYLFLRGRLKELVNRGGEKVSPREVEDALLAHASVAQAVVFAQPHARLGEEVAGAVVMRNGDTVPAAELQRFVATRLAPFKVPRTIVFLDELPKGATGKIQRIGLAERLGLPTLGADAVETEYVAPRTQLEERLCELFADILAVRQVGVDDDFFALGGDSFHVAQLLSQIDEELGRDTETLACVLLRAPTAATLAALLEESDESGRVVRVGPDRGGLPFFFFPTHDWATVGFGALAQRLGGDSVLHTFQPDLAALTSTPPSVAGLAERFAADVRSTQPHGPYTLGGHCFGAALALEVARILHADGEEIAALVLLNPIGEHPRRSRVAARWTLHHARRGTLQRWIRQRVQRARTRRRTKPREVAALARASAEYIPAPYPGRVTILAGADYITPERFWTQRADAVSWRHIPGYTDVLFRQPFVDALANELDDVLAAGDRPS